MQNHSQRVCLRCGKLVSSGYGFCTSCGSDLGAPPRPGVAGSLPPCEFQRMASKHMAPGGQAPAETRFAAGSGYPVSYYHVKKTEDLSILSLICAIASLAVLPFFPAIAAIILGVKARERIRLDPDRLSGEGLATAGIVIGLIDVALVVGLLLIVLVVALAGGALLPR